MPRHSALEQAAHEYIWLWDFLNGTSLARIAAHAGLSVKTIARGIRRASRAGGETTGDSGPERLPRPPRLIPLFPCGAFTPMSACAHRGPIPAGSSLVCMGCHQSGKDAHPALQLDADDLTLIPKKASAAKGPTRVPAVDRRGRLAPGKTETRRERRARLYAEQVDQTA